MQKVKGVKVGNRSQCPGVKILCLHKNITLWLSSAPFLSLVSDVDLACVISAEPPPSLLILSPLFLPGYLTPSGRSLFVPPLFYAATKSGKGSGINRLQKLSKRSGEPALV